ncbi:serine/arginine-rich splicing factor 12-like isoform X2 [Leptotrombidium deliense]|uniref:Serine/arginine-rich splicing factor 12-like isoform X2 n=1 Tax=Leptotrombidium deliense TaxID=299467 RepID=A0A443SQH1_9ACAR|nr:serine/arginine-rich splicing factor 12-like isoform X2 [Leptotrombidium deliense]
MSESDSPPSKSLFIKNISDETRVSDLKQLFGKYGSVSDVYIPVDYYTRRPRDQREAKDALYNVNGMRILGRDLQVEFAQGDRKSKVWQFFKPTPYEMRRKERSSFANNRYNGRYPSRSRSRDRGTRRMRSRSRDRVRGNNSRRSRSNSRQRRQTHHHLDHHHGHRRHSEQEFTSRLSPPSRHHSRHDSSHGHSRRERRKSDSHSESFRKRSKSQSRSQSPAKNRVNGNSEKGRRDDHD